MLQRFRHIVHIIIAYISDYLSLLGRPLFYQIQFQHFRNDFDNNTKRRKLCLLGNGPSFSLIEKHLDQLKDFDFCAVNLSVNTDLFFKLKPKMLVMVDMLFWQKPESEHIKKAWDNIQRIDWAIQIFIPYDFPYHIKEAFEKNKNVTVRRYANNSWEPETKYANRIKMWLYKKGLVSPNFSNVSLSAIYAAILCGYKEINLLGVEHSWMKDIGVNNCNEVVVVDRHYYGENETVWRNYDGTPIRLIDFLSSQLVTFTGHLYLQEFADYMNVKIFNRTTGSFIDAYEKRTLDTLFDDKEITKDE